LRHVGHLPRITQMRLQRADRKKVAWSNSHTVPQMAALL